MTTFIKSIMANRRGVSAVEYALIAAAVLVTISAGAALLTPAITAKFTAAAAAVSS